MHDYPDNSNYRIFDLTATSSGSNKILIHSRRTQNATLLSSSEASFLLSCRTFEPLSTHSERYAQQLKWQQLSKGVGLRSKILKLLVQYATNEGVELSVYEKEIQSFFRQLQEWVSEGFLISKTELLDEITTLVPQNSERKEVIRITAMGIPTCSRPSTLKRCLESFIQNFNCYEHTPDILIFDDSSEKENQQKNKVVLIELRNCYPGNFFYMNREERAVFAKAIADQTNIDPEIMKFAFMGHPACDRSEGGCRNAFLLLTHGQPILQTDDDTICRIAQPPVVRSDLTLTSRTSSDEYWYFKSYEEAIDSVNFRNADFLNLHEEFLGKAVSDIVSPYLHDKNDIDIEKLQPTFLRKMASDEARIRMTLVGPVGDTCLFTDLYRLFLEGEPSQRLVDPPEDFIWHLATRQVIRGVTRPTITDFPRCIGMNFAVDNRDFLPPFMPVQARCDGIFGDLLSVCFHHAFGCDLPYLLAHSPPKQRTRIIDDVYALQEQVRVNDIVAELIYTSQAWPYGDDPKENLRSLGKYFMGIGSYATDQFRETLYNIYASAIGRRIQMTEQVLVRRGPAPAYFTDHVQRYMETLRNSLIKTDFLKPADLDSSCPDSGEAFKEIIYFFGQLLYHWPDIYEAMENFDQDEIYQFLTKI